VLVQLVILLVGISPTHGDFPYMWGFPTVAFITAVYMVQCKVA